jgi:hypothetical protein
MGPDSDLGWSDEKPGYRYLRGRVEQFEVELFRRASVEARHRR